MTKNPKSRKLNIFYIPSKSGKNFLWWLPKQKTFNTCLTKLDLPHLYISKKLSWQLPFLNCHRALCGNWLLGIRGHMSGFSLVRSIEPMKIRHETGNSQYKSSNVVLGNLDQWEASHVGTNVHIGNRQYMFVPIEERSLPRKLLLTWFVICYICDIVVFLFDWHFMAV